MPKTEYRLSTLDEVGVKYVSSRIEDILSKILSDRYECSIRLRLGLRESGENNGKKILLDEDARGLLRE